MNLNNAHKMPKELFHPKYWVTWFFAAILFLVVNLVPYKGLMKLGKILGHIMEKVMPYRLLIARTNIQLCFAKHRWESLYKSHVESVGKGFLEMAMGWLLFLPRKQPKIEHQGRQYVDAALASGKGVIFLGVHTTSLDFGVALINEHYPTYLVYRPSKNAVLNYLITRSRLRHCSGIIEKNNLREMFHQLKKGQCVWYGCDQDFGKDSKSVFAPFYGVSTLTLPYYAKIAQKTGAAVIPMAGFRDEEHNKFIIKYFPEIDVSAVNDVEASTMMNEAIEKLLMGYEDQYYWVHRRFKTRPEGEASIYPPKSSHARKQGKLEDN